MDTLSTLINLLDDQDKSDFKTFLSRKNTRADVKNIKLFDLLKTDDIHHAKKLYEPAQSPDAYHALRKRLQDNLLQYLSQRSFERNSHESLEILRYLVVSRFLLENDMEKIGFRTLVRAERLAEEHEQYSLLNELLMLRLQFSHMDPNLDLEKLTERFRINQNHLQREAKLNLAYASLRKELKAIHLEGKVVNLTDLIVRTIRHYQINVLDLMNYKSLYQILYIANEYAAIYQNYSLIDKYLERSRKFISTRPLEKTNHVFYHLHILYYLANFTLRNRAFGESVGYLDRMTAVLADHKVYLSQFFLRQQMLFALDYHFMGLADQALVVLDHAFEKMPRQAKDEDVEDLLLCKVMFLAQRNDPAALKVLAKLTHSDAWYEKKLGMLWTIRKTLMEAMVHAQFENMELASSRLTSFKRRYRAYLSEIKETRVLDFVSLLERYFQKPSVSEDPRFRESVLRMLEVAENQDIFNLSFIAWVIARWDRKGQYAVVLELVNRKKGRDLDS